MYQEEFDRISHVLNRLKVDANAKIVFLVDKNGSRSPAPAKSISWTRRRSRRSRPATLRD